MDKVCKIARVNSSNGKNIIRKVRTQRMNKIEK
jgi:hypothetical protein